MFYTQIIRVMVSCCSGLLRLSWTKAASILTQDDFCCNYKWTWASSVSTRSDLTKSFVGLKFRIFQGRNL
jgi:hypothetical protein